jgi:beta-lactamase superfamily II metal-dependent hydrolase
LYDPPRESRTTEGEMRVYFGETDGKITALGGTGSKYVIWGDWFDVEDHPTDSKKYVVNWRVWNARTKSVDIEKYVVAKKSCQPSPLLEMMFLDVGQGDGCILNVPHGDRHRTLLIDAGQRRNMHGFLEWRFRNVDERADFHAAIITHPDSDHYAGFQRIFNDPRIRFDHVLHNGLVERPAATKEDRLGERHNGFCTDLFETKAKLGAFLEDLPTRGDGLYTKLLWSAIQSDRFGEISMASSRHGDLHDGIAYLPGFAPGEGATATIEILGPVPEEVEGRLALREFGSAPNDGGFDLGKTKNGHSVILKMRYGDFSVIFGGDLNRPSEDYLLRHYGGIAPEAPLRDAVAPARARLGADMLKCCHHGSADVTDEFLEAVNPFGFVVSSGDEESHVHPRPEILGLLGKKGRGERPLVLCTEILRSTPESKRLNDKEQEEYDRLLVEVENAVEPDARKNAKKKVTDFWNRRFARLVNVYGAINIRTDGNRLIVAFRKEKRATGSPWQLYEYKIHEGEWAGVELKKKKRH